MSVIYLYFVLFFVSLYGEGSCAIMGPRNNTLKIKYAEYYTVPNQEIVIPIMIHLDKAMTRQVPKIPGSRRKLKLSPKTILRDVEKVFNVKSLNQRVQLKLINVRAIGNKTVTVNDNVSEYLRNYCAWQKSMKVKRGEPYFSVLLTGLDMYSVGKKGEKVEGSTGRGYMGKMCSMHKSCALVKWDDRDLVYLLAHEIAHSLGVFHDGLKNNCRNGFIMYATYSRQKIPQSWSTCSRSDLHKFLRSKKKSWCVTTKSKRTRSITLN